MQQGEWIDAYHINTSASTEKYENHILVHALCPMVYQELCVFSNGDYALCCFDSEGCVELGNVKRTPIKETYANRIEAVKGILMGNEFDICKGCSFLKNK